DALQAGLDDGPLGTIDHDGDAGDLGLSGYEIEILGHDGFAVEECFVEIDVEDVSAAVDLTAGDAEGFFEFIFFDEASEFFAAGDVGALADHDEIGFRADREGFQPAEASEGLDAGAGARGKFLDGGGDGLDVGGRGAAAAADDIDPAAGGEFAEQA